MTTILKRHNRIDAMALDTSHYTETLLQAAYDVGLYDDKTVTAIRGDMFSLLAERLEMLTNGESCSVTAETAQAVLSGILYTLDLPLLGCAIPDDAADLLANTTAAILYDTGVSHIRRKLRAAELIYRKHRSVFDALPDSVMKTTAVHGISGFFRAYRPDVFADLIPITADYPLYLDHSEITAQRGVTFLGRYLQGLSTEARFLSKFRTETLHAVLSAADPLYRENPSNLFAPMLATVIGMALLHRPFSAWKYGLEGEDIDALCDLYDTGHLTESGMLQAAEGVIDLLMLDGTCAGYVRRAVPKLRESAEGCLRQKLPMLVFPCTDAAYCRNMRQGGGHAASIYDDMTMMAALQQGDGLSYRGGRLGASAFRQLDYDLRNCTTKEEQTNLILSRVQGLEDICDLLTADTGTLDAAAKAHLLSVLPGAVRLYLSEMVGENFVE